MKIYDISLPISPSMPVWPGDSPVRMEQTESMDKGSEYNMTRLSMSVHTGTHVDAPHHFLNDGRTVDGLSLDVLVGPAYVLHLPDEIAVVTADVLAAAGIPPGVSRLLLRTRNSRLWAQGVREFQTDFVAVAADGAEWLAARGIRLVGMDYLSVAPYDNSVPTHRILLQAGVILLEGLDLSAVPQGDYLLYCLPLNLLGSDGAPARAILAAL
jgi:arylformamidase